MRLPAALLTAALAAGALGQVHAHGGGVDRHGCHTDRSTGVKHCHNNSSSTPTPEDRLHAVHGKPSSTYDRDSWSHWDDLDGDGRDTREQMLEDQSLVPVIKQDGKIVKGLWVGVLTGKKVTKPSGIHIDHVIPLAYASRAGGWAWSPRKKQLFANDPDNTIIATASANTSKSDRGPEEWMPRKGGNDCEYLASWVNVSRKYELELTDSTRNYIQARGDCFTTRR